MNRRTFLKVMGAGLLITVTEGIAVGQRGGGGSRLAVVARLYLNEDGTITALTGKVEEGQGARSELTQAAAEELRVGADQVRLVMADSMLTPDDGMTAGSRTTPQNVPAMRQGAATARELLKQLAAEQWQVEPGTLVVEKGTIRHLTSSRTMSYGDLAKSGKTVEAFKQAVSSEVTLTPVNEWDVMGVSTPKSTLRDLVTGKHRFPSDVVRPNMLYGKVLRPPSYGATLESVDLSAAEGIKDVVVVRDGEFVGCAAPTTYQADQAVKALAKTAKWKTIDHPSSKEIHNYLKEHAQTGGRARPSTTGSVEKGFAESKTVLSEVYTLAYIQHTPMEPRAATVEWNEGKLTAWAGVDYPHRIQGDLARAFNIPADNVRVIAPDMGGGFGGKHSGEAAEEAARLAKAANRPVAVHWTRAEEFTWAYFRPGAVIECKGGLDENGKLLAWEFTNINAGSAAIGTPYIVPHTSILSASSNSPLAQGPYRCLAATGNNFARESFMDELAAATGADPLEFRLSQLGNPRIKTVLEEAARRFGWAERRKKVTPELGVGLACGTEKNSVVAACVEVSIDRKRREFKLNEICEVFECGPIINPDNLISQIQGCIIMGLGGVLREEMRFAGGTILNASFRDYLVPRFADTPKINVHLMNKTDIPSAGGGETPIIVVAPAMGNAVYAATGVRLRSLPMKM